MKSLSSLVLLLISSMLFSQSISGTVIDEGGEPIPFSSVAILDTDSVLFKGGISDADGRFNVLLNKSGDYLVQISSIGFEPLYLDVALANESVSLGSVQMASSSQQLEEVVVEAKKPLFEQQIDRLVVNVGSSITASGGSALDVLARSPGVVVDQGNSTLSMAGKQGVRIMINGKFTRLPMNAVMQMLEGMNAENIESIELITTPPAKYEAEGDAGIINIVLKQTEDLGLNGSYSAFVGYGLRAKYGGSLDFNYRNKGFNVYGGYSVRINQTEQGFTNRRTFEEGGTLFVDDAESFREAQTGVHNARLGVDFSLGESTNLGFQTTAFVNTWMMDAKNDVLSTEGAATTLNQDIFNQEINDWYYLINNVSFKQDIGSKHALEAQVDYIIYDASNPSDYQTNDLDPTNSLVDESAFRVRRQTPINIWVPRIDYSYNVTESFLIELGAKASFFDLENDVAVDTLNQANVWVADPTLTELAMLGENVLAGYISARFSLSPKIEAQTGIRYETTETLLDTESEGRVLDRNFDNFFPSVFLNHKINENHSMVYSFSRRITRPQFSDIAPFVLFLDPNTLYTGNESLRPGITNAYRVEYRYLSYLVSFNYSRDKNAIARFQSRIDPETNRQLNFTENMTYRDSYNVTLSVPIDLTDNWTMRYNLTASRQITETDHLEEPLRLENNNINLNASTSLKLPRDFSFEVSGFYQSRVIFGVAELQPFGSLNVGVEKKFKEDRGTLRFNVNDVLNTQNFKVESYLPDEDVTINRLFDIEGPVFNLTYSRNFGNSQLRSARSRRGSEDEQRRLN